MKNVVLFLTLVILFFTVESQPSDIRKLCLKGCSHICKPKENDCLAKCDGNCERAEKEVTNGNTLDFHVLFTLNARENCATACLEGKTCPTGENGLRCRYECNEKCREIHPLPNEDPKADAVKRCSELCNEVNKCSPSSSCSKDCSDKCQNASGRSLDKETQELAKETRLFKLIEQEKKEEEYLKKQFSDLKENTLSLRPTGCRKQCIVERRCEKGIKGLKCRFECRKGCHKTEAPKPTENVMSEDVDEDTKHLNENQLCRLDCVLKSKCLFGEKGNECRKDCRSRCNPSQGTASVLEVSKKGCRKDCFEKEKCKKGPEGIECRKNCRRSCLKSLTERINSDLKKVGGNVLNAHFQNYLEKRQKCEGVCQDINSCKSGKEGEKCVGTCREECKKIHPVNTLFDQINSLSVNSETSVQENIVQENIVQEKVEEAPEMNTLSDDWIPQ